GWPTGKSLERDTSSSGMYRVLEKASQFETRSVKLVLRRAAGRIDKWINDQILERWGQGIECWSRECLPEGAPSFSWCLSVLPLRASSMTYPANTSLAFEMPLHGSQPNGSSQEAKVSAL